MTGTALITALVVGVAIGTVGRRGLPGRDTPIWLTVAVGVACALLGTVLAYLAGMSTAGFNILLLVIQVVLAALGVALVSGTARPRRQHRAR